MSNYKYQFPQAVLQSMVIQRVNTSYPVGLHNDRYRGSYMSAHVLLNLLNELGKRDKMRGLPSILSLFRNEFNKFNNTRARMLDSIYHMTLKLLWSKNVIIVSLCTLRYCGRHNVSRKSINHYSNALANAT